MAETEIVIRVPGKAALAHCYQAILYDSKIGKVQRGEKIGEMSIRTGLGLRDSELIKIGS